MTQTIYSVLTISLWIFILYEALSMLRRRYRAGKWIPGTGQEWRSLSNDVLTLAMAIGLLFLLDSRFKKPLDAVLSHVHDRFPETEFKSDPVGRSQKLSDYSGKLIILNIWASWCGPCRLEMPGLDDIQKEFGQRGLSVIALSDEPPSTVRDFILQHPYSFTTGSIIRSNNMLDSLDTRPVSILIDPEGRILDMAVGARGHAFFSSWVKSHLQLK